MLVTHFAISLPRASVHRTVSKLSWSLACVIRCATYAGCLVACGSICCRLPVLTVASFQHRYGWALVRPLVSCLLASVLREFEADASVDGPPPPLPDGDTVADLLERLEHQLQGFQVQARPADLTLFYVLLAPRLKAP